MNRIEMQPTIAVAVSEPSAMGNGGGGDDVVANKNNANTDNIKKTVKGLAVGIVICDSIALLCWLLTWVVPVLGYVLLIALIGTLFILIIIIVCMQAF